jgi:hypothetical protein
MTTTVPSHAVTAEMLEAWGFTLAKRDHCVGMLMLTKGMSFGEARHAAWVAGFTHIASHPTEFVPKPVPSGDAEAIAWGLAQKEVPT